jgi:hypothetical protein
MFLEMSGIRKYKHSNQNRKNNTETDEPEEYLQIRNGNCIKKGKCPVKDHGKYQGESERIQ